MSITDNENIEKILYMGVGRSGLENESSIIAKALSELMEYRAIGTVEDIEKSMQNVSVLLVEHEVLKLYQSIGTIEELQEAKIQYDNINSVAESITLGGVSDFETAKESVISTIKSLQWKNTSKKVVAISLTHEGRVGNCPNCNNFVLERKDKKCPRCRRELDWSK